MKVEQTLGNPAFRHESALRALSAPEGYILTAHPGFRGIHFRLWEFASGQLSGRFYWPELGVKFLLSPTRPEVLIHHQERLLVHNLLDDSHTEQPLEDVSHWQISPGGELLVLASANSLRGYVPGEGVVWENDTNCDLQFPIRFSPDGSHFVFRREDELRILCSKDGATAWTWPRHKGESWALTSRLQLYLGDREAGLHCWDLVGGQFLAHQAKLNSQDLLLSPCERFLSSVESRAEHRLLKAGDLGELQSCSGVEQHVFTPQGELITSGADYGLRFHSLPTAQDLGSAAGPHPGHRRPVRAVAWLPDGSLVSSGWDGRVLRWRSGEATEIVQLESSIDVMRVSPDGSVLALGGQNLGIVLWDLEAGVSLELEPAGHTMTSWERGKGTRDFQGWLTRAGLLEFTDHGSRLTAVLGYDTLASWEVATGRLALCEDKPAELYYAAGGAIDPGGTLYLAMGYSEAAEITLYCCQTGQKKASWTLTRDLVEVPLAVSREHLFIACDDGTLVALDTRSGDVVDRIQVPARCLCLAASRNGTVVLGSDSGALFRWRPGETLQGPFDLPNGGLWCTAVALSPCGKKVATGHGNGVCLLATSPPFPTLV